MPAPSSTISFRPDPTHLDQVFNDLADQALSLREVAHRHNTSTEALAAWMTRPDIRDQLESSDSVSTWRTRLLAKSLLPKVLNACVQILDHPWHGRPARGLAPIPDPSAPTLDPIRAALFHIRSAETTRRAASLILQLSRVEQTRAPSRQPTNPSVHPLPSTPVPSVASTPPIPFTPTPPPPPTFSPRPPRPGTPTHAPSIPHFPSPLRDLTPISTLLAMSSPALALLASAGASSPRPRPHEHWP